MLQLKKVLITSIITSLFISCSLNYGTEQNSESTVPEFSFTNASFNSYEDNKVTMSLKAEKLEQYKTDGSSYAENAQFKTYDKDGVLDTDGFCKLLASDSDNKKYSLFNGISIKIHSQEMSLSAQSLHFNGKTEQLTAGQDETVTVERKGTKISGTGFSASGISKKFVFASTVDGTTTDSQDTADESEEPDEYHDENQKEGE